MTNDLKCLILNTNNTIDINTDIEKMLDFLRYLFIIIAGVIILLDLL